MEIDHPRMGKLCLLAFMALFTGCTNGAATSSNSALNAGSSLTINPSLVSVAEGQSVTFSASGGSGSGYSFSMVSGGSASGTVSSSGNFVAAENWLGTTYVLLSDSAGDQVYATVNITQGSNSSTSTLSISPSTITLTEGASYTFTASGGSGSGYYFVIPASSVGTVTSAGVYTAPSDFTGETFVAAEDSAGDIAYATVTISATSSGSTPTSMTGTLTDCVGIVGGTENVNNWQVNGTELRTINDANDSIESPIWCEGLSIAGSIPSTATIQGVSVSIFLINQSSAVDGSYLETMGLIYNGSTLGTDFSLDLEIPGNTAASFPTFTEGGSTNTWTASLTPAIVNSSTFGVFIQTFRGNDRLFLGNSSTIAPQMTIYYSE